MKIRAQRTSELWTLGRYVVWRFDTYMNRSGWIFVVIAAVALFYFTRGFHGGGGDTIEYRGEHFKMGKTFWSYEDYKDDPNNLNTNGLSHIEAVMIGANIGTNFDTREQFVHAVFSMKFPGYGLSQFGEKQQADGSMLSMFSVEIPQRDKDRYFVARMAGSHLTLVDDFVASSVSNVISKVTLEGMSLHYYDGSGSLVRAHQMTQ